MNEKPLDWLRVQIEPFDIPMESDGSVLLSTIQSVIPGAHGLYFRKEGQQQQQSHPSQNRSAVRYDASTGRLNAPENGWKHSDIFVYLAHGTRHGICGGGTYETASKQFQQSVAMVQKLMSGGNAGRGVEQQREASMKRQSASPIRSNDTKPEVLKRQDSMDEEMNSPLSEDSNLSSPLMVKGRRQSEEETRLLKEENDRLKKQLNDESKSAENRSRELAEKVEQLQRELDQSRQEMHNLQDNLEQFKHKELNDKVKEATERLENQVQQLQTECDQHAEHFRNMQQEYDQKMAEERRNWEEQLAIKECENAKQAWHLGEHGQWLADEKARNSELESALRAAHDGINEKQHENEVLRDKTRRLEEELQKIQNDAEKSPQSQQSENHSQTEDDHGEETMERLRYEEQLLMSDSGMSEDLRDQDDKQKKTEFKQIIAEIQRQLDDTHKQNAEMTQSNGKQWAEIDRLNASIDEKQAQNEQLKNQLHELEKRKFELEWHLGEHRGWLEDFNDLEQQVNNLKNEIENQNGEIIRLKDQIWEGQHNAEELQKTIEDLNVKIASHNSDHSFPTTPTWSIDQRPTSGDLPDLLERRDEIHQIQHEQIQHQVEEELEKSELFHDYSAEEKEQDAQHVKEEIMSRFHDLEHQNHQLRTEIEQKSGELHQLYNQRNDNEGRIHRFEDDNRHLHEQLDRKINELTNLQEQMANDNESLWEYQGVIAGLQQQIREHEWHLGENKQWLHDCRNRITELEAICAKNADEITRLNEEKEEMSSQMETLSTHSANYDEVYEAVEEEAQQIHESNGESTLKPKPPRRRRTKDLEVDLKAKIEQLKKQEWDLDEHKNWLQDAKTRIADLEGANSKLAVELDEKMQLIHSLHDELHGLRDDCEKLQQSTNLEHFEKVSTGQQQSSAPSGHDRSSDANHHRMIDELNSKCTELESQLNDMAFHKERLEKELEYVRRDREQNAPMNFHENQRSDFELSNELLQVNRRKYQLDGKIKLLECDLQKAEHRVTEFDAEHQRRGEELWLANERIANQARELVELQEQLARAHADKEQLRTEIQSKYDGPEDFHKEIERLKTVGKEANEKLDWRIGELTQWWNDAKWRIGELEAENAEKRWMLDQANHRIHQLGDSSGEQASFIERSRAFLHGAFIVRKMPYMDREKWQLAIWGDNSPHDFDFRRIWFEVDVTNARHVYLMGSFFNWECALLCDHVDGPDSSRRGVWVDIPVGRHEFRYYADGQWLTTGHFPTVPNEFGSNNNWRIVE